MSTKCIKPQTRIKLSKKGALRYCLTASILLYTATLSLQASAKHILIYGDSLSAAYGIDLDQGWASILDTELGPEHTVSNASISGETSGGGLARLATTIAEIKPDVVFLELGANDGLRGYSIAIIKQNLESMITILQDQNIDVVIAGISLPPSYGPRYIDQFKAIFRDIATESNLPFIDMYNENFLLKDGFMQQDGLHPTALAQPSIAEAILKFLEEQKIFTLEPKISLSK